MTEVREQIICFLTSDLLAEFLKIMKVGVVIVCAGKGNRLGARDKVSILISGEPLLSYSLKAFSRIKQVKQVVIVVSKKNISFAQTIIDSPAFRKYNINVVKGGKERQDSVKSGLKALDESIDYVLIHDGARPLVSKSLINRMLKALSSSDAVICALSARDTLKRVNSDNIVVKTIDRSSIVSVQTPQAFKRDVIMKAYRNWRKACSFDDAQAVEELGVKIKVVEGEVGNFKVTYPQDLKLANLIIGKK
jgi:2-C-methyl-D-erythritol 4-phosphate cytidylyltransferase